MVELIIKFSAEQEPKAGISFNTEYQARKKYEELISHGNNFTMSLEPVRSKLTACLISDDDGAKAWYREVKFKHEQILRLRRLFTTGSVLHFVHTYWQSNQLLVAKPFRTRNFIRINTLNFISVEGSPDQF